MVEWSDHRLALERHARRNRYAFPGTGNTNMWRGGNARRTRDNVDGTRNVVEAALANRVRRLVVISSISAYGPVSGEITEDDASLAADSRVNYQRTK